MTKTRKHRCRKTLYICILMFLLYFLYNLYASAHLLKIREYRIQSEKITNPVKIAFISDLHGAEFGKENKNLVSMISDQQPDLICITGDLVAKSKDTLQIAEKLIRQLSMIAPVYASMGNHEYEYSFCNLDTIKEAYQAAGAVILDYNYSDITINKENGAIEDSGQQVRIGGFYGYGCPYEGNIPKDKDSLFLTEFQNTEAYKLLLSHMPHGWYHAGSLDFWDIDLVLCGHTHGGQIRLPLIGGLYAPDMNFFPGKEMGVYKSEDNHKAMILTTGLGNTESIPRFNNRPEVVVVDIEP